MAIAFVSASNNLITQSCCGSGNFTIAAPAGAVSTNILTLVINLEQSCCGSPSAISTPTGWTRHFFVAGYTTNTSAALYTCNYVSGTTGLVFAVTHSGSPTAINFTYGCSAFSGCDQTTWLDTTPVSSANASSTNLTASTITSVTNNAQILNLYAYNGTGTITDAAGTTQRVNRQNAVGSVYQADQLFSSAGATGSIIATIVGAKVSRGYTIALRPTPPPVLNSPIAWTTA